MFKYKFTVPEEKKIRVIVNSDAKNEADDQFTIVHALLTPKFLVKGLIGAHFGNRRSDTSMEESYEECNKILDLMNLKGEIGVYRGAKKAVVSKNEYEYSDGAELIVEEAMKEDEKPLFIVFLGPITDLACAYLENPKIAGKLTAIWIGGGKYPNGGEEFNLSNDINAANIVFGSGIDIWQVPNNVYSRMSVSFAELEDKVRPYGKIGRYLFDQLMEFNTERGKTESWINGESWGLGDSPTIGLMMDPMNFAYELKEAPFIDNKMRYHFDGNGRKIRVYNNLLTRFIIEDFFSKLKLTYKN